jgi:HAD superfamily 5'-nucleotidase-like hydrolase
LIRELYEQSLEEQDNFECNSEDDDTEVTEIGTEEVFANSYVDMGKVNKHELRIVSLSFIRRSSLSSFLKIDTVGFDYDYTLVTYTNELLDLIYDMALKRLVNDMQYPLELLDAGLKFEPRFSIRGLAVDRETGWICHLSYTHKVAVAYEGRKKVSREQLIKEYRGKRSLRPGERKKRLKPLNDLFSMAECCLIADVVQFFNDKGMTFCPRNAVVDILNAIGSTHISGDFHRLVAECPRRYFEPKPHLKEVLNRLRDSGKRLIFVSNSPFWYVDAGMKYVCGDDWRHMWEAIIVSAGKPRFYTDDSRPFREVSQTTGRVKFKKITSFEPGEVYAEGCVKEMIKNLNWNPSPQPEESDFHVQNEVTGGSSLSSPNVLYVGDSLFADLVDAKRDFGWTTAAVTPEVEWEIKLQGQASFTCSQNIIDLLLHSLREIQSELGNKTRSDEDLRVINSLERLVSLWREEQNNLLGNPFGSVFRARYQPSLFAHSLRRYCDLYMPNVSAMRHYSPQHRFYPNDARLLSHEMKYSQPEVGLHHDVK